MIRFDSDSVATIHFITISTAAHVCMMSCLKQTHSVDTLLLAAAPAGNEKNRTLPWLSPSPECACLEVCIWRSLMSSRCAKYRPRFMEVERTLDATFKFVFFADFFAFCCSWKS